MIEFVPFTFEDHGQWVKELINPVYCEDTKGIVALRDDKPVAAVITDSWTHTACNVHIGCTDPLVFKHGLLQEAALWIFGVCQREHIVGIVPADNAKALKINKHIGFTEFARIPDGYNYGVDIVLMRLNREDCKYLPTELRKAA